MRYRANFDRMPAQFEPIISDEEDDINEQVDAEAREREIQKHLSNKL